MATLDTIFHDLALRSDWTRARRWWLVLLKSFSLGQTTALERIATVDSEDIYSQRVRNNFFHPHHIILCRAAVAAETSNGVVEAKSRQGTHEEVQ